MKPIAIFLVALLFAACNNSAPTPVANSNTASNDNSVRSQTMIAHSSEIKSLPVANTAKTKWTQSGDPIDTKTFDAEIAEADKAVKAKPNDANAKDELSQAYFNRAMALTEARQYASALGDYRKAVKYNPENEQAKEWIKQIINIYNDMGRESPPEGQEPPPLRINK